MKKRLLIAAALTGALPFTVLASDWQFATESKEQWYYMDFSSLTTVKGYRKAWIREDSVVDQQTKSYPTKTYRSGKFLYYFDCDGRRIGSVQKILYDKMFGGGEIVEQSSIKFNDNILDEVPPDSIGEGLLQVACASATERAKLKAKNKAKEEAILNPILKSGE